MYTHTIYITQEFHPMVSRLTFVKRGFKVEPPPHAEFGGQVELTDYHTQSNYDYIWKAFDQCEYLPRNWGDLYTVDLVDENGYRTVRDMNSAGMQESEGVTQ
jgi:hypothetical protein